MVFMVILAFLVERLVLRQLVNQEEIILFMATIGLYYFLEGFGETVFNHIANSPVPMEALGMEIGPFFIGDVMFQKVDATAAGVAAATVMPRQSRAGTTLARVSYPSTRLANVKDLKANEPMDVAYPDADSPGVLVKLGARVPGGAVNSKSIWPHISVPMS